MFRPRVVRLRTVQSVYGLSAEVQPEAFEIGSQEPARKNYVNFGNQVDLNNYQYPAFRYWTMNPTWPQWLAYLVCKSGSVVRSRRILHKSRLCGGRCEGCRAEGLHGLVDRGVDHGGSRRDEVLLLEEHPRVEGHVGTDHGRVGGVEGWIVGVHHQYISCWERGIC